MTVSTRTVSNELAPKWVAQLARTLKNIQIAPEQTRLAVALAMGLKGADELAQRDPQYPYDSTPISLEMVKGWAKGMQKALKPVHPISLAHAQLVWAQLFGASSWNGLPDKLDAFNAARLSARQEATETPDEYPLDPKDWVVIDGTVLAQVTEKVLGVEWDEEKKAWSVEWLGRTFEGKSSRQKGRAWVRQLERVDTPSFPLNPHKSLLDQVIVLPLRNDRRAREQELTESAIDWAVSCIEDLFEGSRGDADMAADVAIQATLASLAEGDEDESWIDVDRVVAAIDTEFEGMELDDEYGEDEEE